MARKRSARRRARRVRTAAVSILSGEQGDQGVYWQEQSRRLGSRVAYLDSGAILETLSPEDATFGPFLQNELVGDRLVTSTYVVAETVRRLVKARSNEFAGPSGERRAELARLFLRRWLADNDVVVLCVPASIYEEAIAQYQTPEVVAIECDLTDVISTVIVRGLGQNRIVAKDVHFHRFGLVRLPGGV
jgi:predicted nucleic acid-binding protein